MSKQSTPLNLATTVYLVRNKQNAKQILGTLLFYDADGLLIGTLRSLELPEKDNSAGRFYIPSGFYMAQKILSERYGRSIEVIGVPYLPNHLFHVGNYHWQTSGCILVGQDVRYVNWDKELDVVSPMAAMKSMVEWSNDLFQLIIIDVPSGGL